MAQKYSPNVKHNVSVRDSNVSVKTTARIVTAEPN